MFENRSEKQLIIIYAFIAIVITLGTSYFSLFPRFGSNIITL